VRTDIWALGVILFELLTQHLPFVADSQPGRLAAILSDHPLRLRELRPEAPSELEAVIERALRKKPEERFPCAEALRDALLPFSERLELVSARKARLTASLPPVALPSEATTDNQRAATVARKPERSLLARLAGVETTAKTLFYRQSARHAEGHTSASTRFDDLALPALADATAAPTRFDSEAATRAQREPSGRTLFEIDLEAELAGLTPRAMPARERELITDRVPRPPQGLITERVPRPQRQLGAALIGTLCLAAALFAWSLIRTPPSAVHVESKAPVRVSAGAFAADTPLFEGGEPDRVLAASAERPASPAPTSAAATAEPAPARSADALPARTRPPARRPLRAQKPTTKARHADPAAADGRPLHL
jgi:hypothetical protein